MAGNALHFMTNANAYLDGNSLIGRAKEIKLPEINVVQQELGMIGKTQLPAGFDKLEGEIHWTSLYEEVALRTINPFKAYPLQCRGSLQRYLDMPNERALQHVVRETVEAIRRWEPRCELHQVTLEAQDERVSLLLRWRLPGRQAHQQTEVAWR